MCPANDKHNRNFTVTSQMKNNLDYRTAALETLLLIIVQFDKTFKINKTIIFNTFSISTAMFKHNIYYFSRIRIELNYSP